MSHPSPPRALLLLLLVLGASAQNCEVPKIEQEFCNSFYSACLSTPDKLCLAESLSNCIDYTSFPSVMMESLGDFLIEFIGTITLPEIPEMPPLNQPATTTSTTEAPSSTSSPDYVISFPTKPPIRYPTIHKPTFKYPQPLFQFPKPVFTPSPTESTPSTPSTKRPTRFTLPPISYYSPAPTTPSPAFVPIFPDNLYYEYEHGPKDSLPDLSQFTFPPFSEEPTMSLKPQPVTNPSFTPFSSGEYYANYLLTFITMIDEAGVQNTISELVNEYNPLKPITTVDLQAEGQNIENLVIKLDYIISKYVGVEIPERTMRYMCEQIIGHSMELFQWIVIVVDEVCHSLQIDESIFGGAVEETIIIIDPSFYELFTTDFYGRRNIKYCHPGDDQTYCEKYCTDDYGSNWIGILARERQNSYASFERSYEEYAVGFGTWQDGYWMGLNCLHAITSAEPHELLVELTDAAGKTAIAHYGTFSVGDVSTNFQLTVGK